MVRVLLNLLEKPAIATLGILVLREMVLPELEKRAGIGARTDS